MSAPGALPPGILIQGTSLDVNRAAGQDGNQMIIVGIGNPVARAVIALTPEGAEELAGKLRGAAAGSQLEIAPANGHTSRGY